MSDSYTESSILKLLRKRYSANAGNGPEYAYVEHVRNAAGFNASRTADAMALSLWPSRGHELEGFEVKISRSDWRTELKNGAKADVWTDIVDRWWIVAPKGVVPLDELPATWGLLEATDGGKLVKTKQAVLLTEKRHDIKRSFLVPLLRAAGAGLSITPDEAAIEEARSEGWQRGHAVGQKSAGDWEKLYESQKVSSDEDRRAVREIETVLGQSFLGWRTDNEDRITMIARKLNIVLSEEAVVERAALELNRAAEKLEAEAQHVRRIVGSFNED